MNSVELEVEMKRHSDTGGMLADYLGISAQTFSAKKHGKNADFTQSEISMIKSRYDLSPDRINEIFFDNSVS